MRSSTQPTSYRLLVLRPAGASLRSLAARQTDPDDLVVACYFRDPEGRRTGLDSLKRTAALAMLPDRDTDGDEPDDNGDLDSLHRIIGSRARQGLGYHAFLLKSGIPPFASGCLITFEDMDADRLRKHVMEAHAQIEAARQRVLDAFGLVGQSPPDD